MLLNQWRIASELIWKVRIICYEQHISFPIYEKCNHLLKAIVTETESAHEEIKNMLDLSERLESVPFEELTEEDRDMLRNWFSIIIRYVIDSSEKNPKSPFLEIYIHELQENIELLTFAKDEYWKRLKQTYSDISVFNELVPIISARRFQNIETIRRLIEFFQSLSTTRDTSRNWLLRYSKTTTERRIS